MRKKISIIALISFSLCFSLIAQEKRLKSINESETYYYNFGENIVHISGCKLLKGSAPTLSGYAALSKGMKPCPECMSIDSPAPHPRFSQTQPAPAFQSDIEKYPSRLMVGEFRGNKWGATQDQIKRSEKSKFIKKDIETLPGYEILVYQDTVGGLDAFIAYYFIENQFLGAKYIFTAEHVNKNLYLDDFANIKSSLIDKYKRPTIDNVTWSNDLYKNNSQDWGMAVSVGHLKFSTAWRYQIQ